MNNDQVVEMMLKAKEYVFVFGSNLRGAHGAGAARDAVLHWGADLGQGVGRQGMSYAIPTKNQQIKTMSLDEIRPYVDNFIAYAVGYSDTVFQVTQIGCGLAGYSAKQIAPLFKDAPKNCLFDEAWKPWLGDEFGYWGTV